MKTFIDESGEFGWKHSGKSVFCAVSVPDQTLPAVFQHFRSWKHKFIGLKKQREIKGHELTTKQLSSFVELVVMPDENFRLTYVAVDTKLTCADVVDKIRDQWAEVLAVCANREKVAGNKSGGLFHEEMSHWVRGRSREQFLWLMALYASVFEALQNTIFRFSDCSFDNDFEEWDIAIDRSYIKRERHMHFWIEWLRHQLGTYARNHGPFKMPSAWLERGHPVTRNLHAGTNILDGSELFGKRTYFADSQSSEGIQLSDICANILFRAFKNGAISYEPLRLLHARINDGAGGPVRLIHMSEDHIWKDSAEEHVHEVTLKDYFTHK